MYSKKIILSVFLLAAAASLTAAQTPQRNMRDFGFIQHANPWLTSINAAGLGTLSIDRTSYAEAFFDKENGGIIPVEGSDDSWPTADIDIVITGTVLCFRFNVRTIDNE